MDTRAKELKNNKTLRLWVILLVGWPLLLLPDPVDARVIRPAAFTSAAIQQAIDSAKLNDIVQLEAGDYVFRRTVIVDRLITLRGISKLQRVCVVEPGEANTQPNWRGPPSRCVPSDRDLRLFQVRRGGVRIEGLAIVGMSTRTKGNGLGIAVDGADNVSIVGCEVSHFRKGITFSNAVGGLVENCYIHRNERSDTGYGVTVVGRTMSIGGSQVELRGCEFTLNRHAIASNSPLTRFLVHDCYFHDNDSSQQAAVDAHANGAATLRAVIRDCVFERTRPMALKSGSFEITGNYFDRGCGRIADGGYSKMIDFAEPGLRREVFLPSTRLHNIYIGHNQNLSGKPLVEIDTYDYSGKIKHVAYNAYVDGILWEAAHPGHPPRETAPNPLVGYVYLTQPDTDERLLTIKTDTWYDLHAFACDPQGPHNLRSLAIQVAHPSESEFEVDMNSKGTFSSTNNYFVSYRNGSLLHRNREGSSAWSKSSAESYIGSHGVQWLPDGTHRVHFRCRFRLSAAAAPGEWRLFATVEDAEGNCPVPAWRSELEGWPIKVERRR